MEHNYRTLIFFLLEPFIVYNFYNVIMEFKSLTEGQSHGLQIPWSARLVEFTYFILTFSSASFIKTFIHSFFHTFKLIITRIVNLFLNKYCYRGVRFLQSKFVFSCL
jgi:hypothetical protein